MRTISHSRRSRGSGWLTMVAIFLCVVLLGALFFWRASISGMFWNLFLPVVSTRGSSMTASAGFLGQFSSKAQLAEENARLRLELASSSIAVIDRDALYQENLDLKNRLGRNAATRTILAGVIMRPPGTPYDTLLLDAGTAEGVTVGNLVSAGGTTRIGEITEVYAHSSRAVLFSAPGKTYSGMLRGNIPISVEGEGGGSFTAQVPVGTEVVVGDAVLLPGVALGFGGTVTHVETGTGQSFTTLYLRLPVDLFTLSKVEVLPDTNAHAQ